MSAERSNVLAFGPAPVAWLSLPLTQARAAAIVQFEERTGLAIIDALTDALDDIVFDIGPDRQPGATDCRPTASSQQPITKSSAATDLCGNS